MHNENVKYLANGLKVTGSPHWGRRIKQAHLTPDIKINSRCLGVTKDDVVVTGVGAFNGVVRERLKKWHLS